MMVLWLLLFLILGACAPSTDTDAETAIPEVAAITRQGLTCAQENPFHIARMTLTFADEFSDDSLDGTKWNIVNRVKNYTGIFSASNPAMVSVSNGNLILQAQQVPWLGFGFSGGKIDSKGKFSQRYGYFEARLKIPSGSGLHPTWWLFPTSGEWPPEVDIAEFRGSQPKSVNLSNHWFDASAPGNDAYASTKYVGPDFSADYHVYGLSWTPEALTWYVDGIVRSKQTTHIPTIPMDLILDIVLDGYGGGYDPFTRLPAVMSVDYVRVYKTLDSPN